jgi:hypothetical protein
MVLVTPAAVVTTIPTLDTIVPAGIGIISITSEAASAVAPAAVRAAMIAGKSRVISTRCTLLRAFAGRAAEPLLKPKVSVYVAILNLQKS